MRARLLLNPAAGRGRGARAARGLADFARRHDLPIETSTDAADLTRRARRAAEEGCERILAAGGDGTQHHVAQGLAGTPCALAPIALGTGNDLAAALGYPRDVLASAERALTGDVRRIDLGRVGERVYCGVAGAGFDSEVAEYAGTVRRLRGPFVYPYSVLATLWRFRPHRVELAWDGGEFRAGLMFVVLANIDRFGGGMRIAPGADPADGLLDLVLVEAVSRLELLRVFPRVYRGGHLDHPRIRLVRTASARLRFDRPVALYGDGERIARIGPEGIEIRVDSRALAVVHP
jgi:diacylglycerol kinase (ATP)